MSAGLSWRRVLVQEEPLAFGHGRFLELRVPRRRGRGELGWGLESVVVDFCEGRATVGRGLDGNGVEHADEDAVLLGRRAEYERSYALRRVLHAIVCGLWGWILSGGGEVFRGAFGWRARREVFGLAFARGVRRGSATDGGAEVFVFLILGGCVVSVDLVCW